MAESGQLVDGSITTADDLETDTGDGEFERAIVFETSGSTGDPKKVPFNARDLGRQARLGRDAFEILGLTAESGILNLGAPEPHISGLLLENAATVSNVSTYNRNCNDFDRVLKNGHGGDITAVIGSPLFLQSVADNLTTDTRSISDLFPNLDRLISTGANLLPRVENQLREQWDVDRVQEAYASTEFGCIAVKPSMDGLFVPMLDYHRIEVLPHGTDRSTDNLVDIREVSEPTKGSLVISTRDREAYSFDRYDIGDGARVVPTDDGPRLELLGRTDESIQFGAIVLYEGEINGALETVYGSTLADWRAVVQRNEGGVPGVTVSIAGEDVQARPEEFREALHDLSSAIETVDEYGLIDHIDVEARGSVEDCDLPDESSDGLGAGSSRIVFQGCTDR